MRSFMRVGVCPAAAWRSVTLRTRCRRRRRRTRSSPACRLLTTCLGRGLQLVAVVPLHQRQVRHARHVAVGVVGVRFDVTGLQRLRPTVVLVRRLLVLAGLEQAGFVVGVGARPAGMRRVAAAMLHRQEVADGVVDVALEIVPHRVAVAGSVESVWKRLKASGAVGESGCAADLPQVLAARRFDQPVDGVVGVVGARLDALVAEVDRLLGVVADVGDVAGRVVGVVQVLHLAAGPAGWGRLWAIVGKDDGVAPGEQVHQAEGQRVVVVGGPDAVAVLDQRALALGVVVDVGDERRVGAFAAPRRLASTRSSRLASL